MGIKKATKNNIKIIALIILTLFILYLLHIAIGDVFDIQSEHTDDLVEPTIIFDVDYNGKILIVREIYPREINYYWSEISIVNGNATIDQYGIIKIGDTISNCEGYLELEWEITGKILWEGDFS